MDMDDEFSFEQTFDFETVKSTYIDIIGNTPGMKNHARWVYGMHPNDEMIRNYIRKGEMYLFRKSNQIAGVVAINLFQPADYENIEWKLELTNEEVAVPHILAVTPEFQSKGVSKRMVEAVIEFASRKGKKAVRLDTLSCNTPAQHLYERFGFKKCGTLNLYAENTGWIDFWFYEYILK